MQRANTGVRMQRRRMAAGAAGAGLAGLACLAAGCSHRATPQPPAEGAPPPLTAPYAESAHAGAAVYRLDPGASSVWILVGKAGPLASAGHRHVITAGRLQGFAVVHPGGDSHARLRFPAAALSVDAPAQLARFHEHEKLGAADRAGTRRHMLGKTVLDAGRFPWIGLRVSLTHTAPGAAQPLDITIHLHGVTREVGVTAALDKVGCMWGIDGSFAIKQSRFGITPYSVMLGALRVHDRIEIRYHLTFSPWRPRRAGEEPEHAQP